MSNNPNFKKISITLELPLEWANKLDELCLKNKQELAEVISEFIGKNLDLDLKDFQVTKLTQKYQDLEQRLVTLESKDYDIHKLCHRLEIMEKLVAQLQIQRFSSPPAMINMPLTKDDDIEDEPDEILTDFLL